MDPSFSTFFLGALCREPPFCDSVATPLFQCGHRVTRASRRRSGVLRRSAIRPTSPGRLPSISPSRPTCRTVPGEIAGALGEDGVRTEFVLLDDLAARLQDLGAAPGGDDRLGADRRRALLSRLVGSGARPARRLRPLRQSRRPRRISPRTSSPASRSPPPPASPYPPTRLMEGETESPALGMSEPPAGPLFVKPNTLGAKIGIFRRQFLRDGGGGEPTAPGAFLTALPRPGAESSRSSRATTSAASFIDCGGDFADQLGVERIAKNPTSETGGRS